MYNFDPYNVLLSIATNIPVLLMTAFVLQGHILSINIGFNLFFQLVFFEIAPLLYFCLEWIDCRPDSCTSVFELIKLYSWVNYADVHSKAEDCVRI